MAKGRPSAAPVQKERRAGPGEAKQRRTERQRQQEAANKDRRREGRPLPWELAQAVRAARHQSEVSSGEWEPVQRTELGLLVRVRPGGGLTLEDPGRKIRDRILRERASSAKALR